MPIDPNNLSATATLTFDDEFNTLSLWNGGTSGTWATTWWYDNPTGNGDTLASDEQQWYINNLYAPTSSVTPWTVSNGMLDLRAQPASPTISPLINNYQFTSGELNTYHSFSQLYGYFEVRAELPAGQGLWPAFWLLPADGTWPPEIDVFEVLGNSPTTLYTTVHSNDLGSLSQEALASTVANTSTGFHTYGVDWEPDYITWYFDGQAVYRVATPADLNKPMYMILNLGVGGNWPGLADSTTPFPADMLVDYVRAYTAKPGGSSGGLSPSTAVAATGSGDVIGAAGGQLVLANTGVATDVHMLSNGTLVVADAVDAGWGSHSGAANEFSSAGAAIGSSITLSGFSSAGSAMAPTVTPLAGGMWEITYGGAGAPVGYEVYGATGAQIFVDNQYSTGNPLFGALTGGGYVETNTGWGGRFNVTSSSGAITWLDLPQIGGVAANPTAITSLTDGGFVFAFAGTDELDRYNASAGVHSTIHLGTTPLSNVGLAAFSDGVVEAAWVATNASGGTDLMVRAFDSMGAATTGAYDLGAASGGAATNVQLLATGVHDQSVAFWTSSGGLYAASFDGTGANTATQIVAGTPTGAQEAVLTNGDIAVSWFEVDNGVSHLWTEVLDPSTMTGTKQDMGAGDGGARLVALQGGGFAESWHSGSSVSGRAYDGLGHWGAATTVVGDFVGVDANGQLVAVGVNGAGQAVMQHYALGADPNAGGSSAPPPANPVYTGTAANIAANFDALNADTTVTSIVVSDNAAVPLNTSQWRNDSRALSELSNQNGSAAQLSIADTGANISASLNALQSASNVSAISVTDSAALSVSTAQITADAAALGKIAGGYSLAVADTAANLTSQLSSLQGNSHVASLSITDGATMVLSYAQYTADTAILGKIADAHTIEVMGARGTGFSAEYLTYGSSGALVEKVVMNNNGTESLFGYAPGITFTSTNKVEKIAISTGGDTFHFQSGLGAETISGYVPGQDAMNVDHTLFSSFSSMMAAAKNDGHGDVVIRMGGTTVTLVGVSVAQLNTHSSDWHFV